MKVLVLGAAGKTGRAVVDRAKAAGHEVTAFVHHAEGYDAPDGVAVRDGESTDPAAIATAVAGQDAVIDTIGGKTPYKRTSLEADTARAVITAMRDRGVRRLLVTSMTGVGDSLANMPLSQRPLLVTFLRAAKPDKTAMEHAVSASGLDWTIVRPAVLTDKEATGDVRVYTADSREKAHTVTRGDLAAFLVAQLTSDDHLGRSATIANRR